MHDGEAEADEAPNQIEYVFECEVSFPHLTRLLLLLLRLLLLLI